MRRKKLGLSLLIGVDLALGSLQVDALKSGHSKEVESVQIKVKEKITYLTK